MKRVIWIDKKGYKRVSLLRDSDPDEKAENGIPLPTIDVSAVDWERVQRELHNALVERGLFTWKDVQENGQNNQLLNTIASLLRRDIIMLMKLKEKEREE